MTSHKSSALKSIIWRIMGVIVLASVTYFFTGQWKKVSQITPVYTAIKLVMYYIYDKVWKLK